MEAYVLIMTAAGTSPDALSAIRSIDGVTRANIVAGEFDIIALLEGESAHDLLRIVTEHLHEIEGVGNTRTSIVLE